MTLTEIQPLLHNMAANFGGVGYRSQQPVIAVIFC